MRNLEQRLDRNDRIAEAATPGPWVALGNYLAADIKSCTCAGNITGAGHEQFCGLYGPLMTGASPSDSALMAHSRTELPALNAALRAVLEMDIPDPAGDSWDYGYEAAMEHVRQAITDAMGGSDE